MPTWKSEGLLENENSVHYCSGGAGIAGRHGWCTLEMLVEWFLLVVISWKSIITSIYAKYLHYVYVGTAWH